MDNAIIVALISAFSALGIALIPYFLKKREDKKEKSKSLDVDVELFKFNDLKEAVDNILFTTKADRFLILMANNGKEEMRFATAIYEQHKNNQELSFSIGATNKYIKIEFDDEYRHMLKEAEKEVVFRMNVKNMKDSLLKNIYLTEKVTQSNCYFLRRYADYKTENKDLLLFCTLASHSEELYDVFDETKFKTFIDYIKNEIFV